MATVAFATGFTTHGQTSSSLGMFAGTLAVCALVARGLMRRRRPHGDLALQPQA